MHCVPAARPPILAPLARPAFRDFRPARIPRTFQAAAMPTPQADDTRSLPLDALKERARAGDDACRLELLARWCLHPQADPRLGDAVWEQFRRLLYRWIQVYLAQRGLGAELLAEADEPVNDALDSLAAQVLMRFFQSQAGPGLAERFPSMGHVNRFLARVTWTVTGEHLDAQLKRLRHDRPWPEAEAGLEDVDAGGTVAEGVDGDEPLWAVDVGGAIEERLGREALWQRLRAHCHGDAEWVVMVERFVRGLPPREILRRHPDLFASVEPVYKTLERVLARLRKDPDLLIANAGAAS